MQRYKQTMINLQTSLPYYRYHDPHGTKAEVTLIVRNSLSYVKLDGERECKCVFCCIDLITVKCFFIKSKS